MRHFCTLFDRNYLFKGLALYNSLLRTAGEFTLWILCMDPIVYNFLQKHRLENARLIPLSEFEDPELLKVKQNRSVAEYCWTCTPSLPLYILKKYPEIEMIAYLDADLFFYSSPEPIYEEFGHASISIIEHRFPPHLKHLEINGIYNVQMMIFRNDPDALSCLEWWRARCNEWCYCCPEDGKMGDQKYLDDWPSRFQNVHVIHHLGAGVALWNVMQYALHREGSVTYIDGYPLIFYHFHQFHLVKGGKYDFGEGNDYSLTQHQKNLIYKPYLSEIEAVMKQVYSIDPHWSYGFTFWGQVILRKMRGLLGRTKRVIKRVLSPIS